MLTLSVCRDAGIVRQDGVRFELPDSISSSVVPNVPKMTVEEAEQVVA
jgi:hypothetical protein